MKLLYQNTALITDEQIQQTGAKLTNYIENLRDVLDAKDYEALESSVNLPSDEELLQQIKQLVKEKVTPKLKYIIDIGIGGSNLGTKAVYDAVYGYFDLIEPDRFPKMIFADTIDPEFLAKLALFLQKISDPEEILINIISKSGTTTETIANSEIIFSIFHPTVGSTILPLSIIHSRLVITTDEGSKLWQLAEEQKTAKLAIPKSVGGRFSVFSAVGLFPLAACGINIDHLITGAEAAIDQCSNPIIEQNPAALSAIIVFLQNQQGKNINDNFIFHPELESLGKWYRQLMGESIGKTAEVGITPTVSIGSTDLHSMGQLYLGGPKDKITTFIYTETSANISLPQQPVLVGLVDGISGKSAQQIMNAILQGTKSAYQHKKLPFMEIVLDNTSEKSIGEFLQFKMLEIMYLGKLFGVNTFDQPNVEDYKTETRSILNS